MMTHSMRLAACALIALFALPAFAAGGDWYTAETDAARSTFSQSRYVYFKNTSNWNPPYCYVWTGDTNNGWPGAVMEHLTNEVWRYAYDFNADMVIFSNNGANQTGNTTLVAGHLYQPNGSGAATDLGLCDDAIPPKLYLVGNFWSENHTNWLQNPVEMTYEGNGIFTSGWASFYDADSPMGYFQFITLPGSLNWTQVGTVYSASYMDRVIGLNEEQPFYVDTRAHNSFQCEKGCYKIEVNFKNMTVKLTARLTSEAEIEGEQRAPEYYSLQGFKLTGKPAPGTICIERRGAGARTVRL